MSECCHVLQDIADIIYESQGTTREWADFLSLVTLGTIAGPNRPVRTKIGDLGLNLFGCFIGPSGIAHKTTPLKYVLRPLFGMIREEIKEDLLLPSSFSMEGMVQYSANKEGVYSDQGLVMKDEFTILFKESVNKNYLTDEMEFYSHLHDGFVPKRMTRKTQLESAEKTYVSLVGTTTPILYSVLSRDHFIQGLGNRIIWILYKEDSKKVVKDPERWTYEYYVQVEDENRLREIAQQLLAMKNSQFPRMYLSPDASSIVEDYFQKCNEESKKYYKKDSLDLRPLYLSRQTEKLLKLSAIRCFERAWAHPDHNMVTDKDVEWALPRVEAYFEDYKKMIEDWRISPQHHGVETIENYYEAMKKNYCRCRSSRDRSQLNIYCGQLQMA